MTFVAEFEPPTYRHIVDVPDVEEPTARKLHSFAQLEEGWHFGEGSRAEPTALKTAHMLNWVAQLSGWQTDAFPGVSGEIMLSVENAEHYYEVIAEADGGAILIEEVGDEEVQRQKVPLIELLERLSPNLPCVTSVLFTPHTGNLQRTVSPVWLSEIPARSWGEEFRSFNETVLSSAAEPFVHTWEHTTPSLTPRFSSGALIPERFRRIA